MKMNKIKVTEAQKEMLVKIEGGTTLVATAFAMLLALSQVANMVTEAKVELPDILQTSE